MLNLSMPTPGLLRLALSNLEVEMNHILVTYGPAVHSALLTASSFVADNLITIAVVMTAATWAAIAVQIAIRRRK